MIEMKKHEQAMFIAGIWKQKEEMINVYDPATDELIATVPKGTKADMEEALRSAKKGLKIASKMSTRQRMDILLNVVERILNEREEIAQIISSEGVKTISEARREARRAAETLRLCAEEARRIGGTTLNFDQMEGSEHRHGYTVRFPIGIVGAITPFNDPLNLVAHKIGPAIASGNAVILKPATETPLSALWLTRKFIEAGLPKHILNVVTGRGQDVIPPLVEHPEVRLISFTGGLRTGEKLAKDAGLKKISMELGANSPFLVFADADVKKAAKAAVSGAFAAGGQNCLSVQRMLVSEQVVEDFTKYCLEETAALQFGNKKNEQDDVGPLINEREANRVIGWVDAAVDAGATVLIGGKKYGNYVEPTIMQDVPRDSLLYQEEIFGPVAMIQSFTTYDEAMTLANEVNYGLQAGVFTTSLQTAHNTIRDLHVGGVMINDSSDFRIDAMPFGGTKGSGVGREGVYDAMLEMTEQRVVCFNDQDQ
ncbi:aldehyde dehydrogenase family protein [Geomicrobium sediminis]|uniref:Glyceraldehyde-3-phosphate dehydrogenase (NADP+) n=1 Tax=Geomicrobium sediminis TaxID=1347788 RepID=A0ABS2PEA7_9BACL|nr:aldehyde dehydrogenase family protein [Geomicrobium sediminis]MBM7633466.1 glyceraldehyde-3-phosphate dehydrogenase (NADP+) [Geomicrobium sediminis]